MRVLLADDDLAMRDFVRRALEDDGYDVTIAQDGTEAIETLDAATTPFDILVTDIAMPGLDGLTVAQKLLSQNSDMRILLMSALDSELERAKSLKGSNIKTLSKPFSLDDVKSAVSGLLAR